MKNYPLFALLILNSACALLPDKSKTPEAPEKVGQPHARPQAGIEAKQLAAETEAVALAEIVFEKGKSRLREEETVRLKPIEALLAQRRHAERVIIAAWADQAAPGEGKKPLSTNAVRLAQARGEALRERLEKMGAKDIELHNMAKKPTKFAKFISSEDARIKKSLEGARSSRAVIMLIQIE